jgi:hypothetical protein
MSNVGSLDHLLSESDADSMDWSDGSGHEVVSELLAKFSRADWVELEAQYQGRSSKWRECLASALHPQYGEVAERMLFAMAGDATGEVAFYALSSIAFHCGVNANSKGAFLDPRVQIPSFLEAARRSPGLSTAIERVAMHCSADFNCRLQLLAEATQP